MVNLKKSLLLSVLTSSTLSVTTSISAGINCKHYSFLGLQAQRSQHPQTRVTLSTPASLQHSQHGKGRGTALVKMTVQDLIAELDTSNRGSTSGINNTKSLFILLRVNMFSEQKMCFC